MLATITYQRIFFHLHLGLDGERLEHNLAPGKQNADVDN